jgi:hypothetical protein
MVAGPDGIHRSAYVVAPMLVGAWRTRVLVPADFETRYVEAHRRLMLAHERAHQQRGDALVNSLATAWLCIFWFNPLTYWAVGRMRFDQDLACDALVISKSGATRREYADALFKAQLNSDSAWPLSAGCHWQSTHPLKERISMLKLNQPTRSRRFAGVAFTIVMAASGMYLVSSAFAQQPTASKAAESAPQKFSLNAKDAGVRQILKNIAAMGGRNVLVGDHVKGTLTHGLENVTWREALNAVVQSQGLVMRDSGNITIVDVPK